MEKATIITTTKMNPFEADEEMQNGSRDFSFNNETDQDEYTPYHERPETYIVPVVFFIIFVVGVLGNGTLIVIFVRNRNMRNIPNTYIFSLALGDILVILTCVPFTSTVYTVESWPYGLVVCKLSEFVKDISIGVSVFTLTALSADRYFAITDPMRKHMGHHPTKVTLISAVSIWIIAIFFALPSVIFSYLKDLSLAGTNNSVLICYPFPDEYGTVYQQFIVMFKFLSYYAIPLFIIAGFYVFMAHHLLLSARNMPGEMQYQSTQIQARKKVAKMILSFVIIFAICFLPYHIFMLWFYFSPNAFENYDDFWNAFRIVGFCLSFINSCINPIALYCVSGTFRKHYNRYLFCCLPNQRQMKHRRNRSTYESSNTLINFNSTLRRNDEVTVTTTSFKLDKT